MQSLLSMIGAALAITAAPQQNLCKRGHAATASGVIAYRDCGHGDPILIIPGGPGLDADYITGLARMLTEQGHRAVLIEPRGTGASRSALGDASQLTVDGSVADVEAVRQAINATRVSVLGHSFGGAVAQAYAAADPEHVRKLVLMDSVGPNMHGPHGSLDSWRQRLTRQDLEEYEIARAKGERVAAMKIKFRGSFYHQERGKAFVDRLADSSFHVDLAPLSQSYQRYFQVKPRQVRELHVAIVVGAIDWIRGYEPLLRTTYPQACVIVIPKAGHFPWVDSPQATRVALRRSLPTARAIGTRMGRVRESRSELRSSSAPPLSLGSR